METKNKQELIKKIKELNIEEKYEEVSEILNDELLEKINNYELYAEISQATCRLEKNGFELYAQKSLELKENAKANHYFGVFFRDEEKDINKAEKYFLKAIELNNRFYLSLRDLGYLYFEDYNNLEKAEEFLNKALKVKSNCANSLNVMGAIFYNKKDYKVAINYYLKSIDSIKNFSSPYYNLGLIYFEQEKYKESKDCFLNYIKFVENKDYFFDIAKSKIIEINKILTNEDHSKIQKLVTKVQKLLEYEEDCITHFTSISVAKELILNNSKFRLSEGTYLNDTSEGTVFFDMLKYESPLAKSESKIDDLFVQKPFIGSFVSQDKHNDLTMWRMYGKEGKEEARGCALTMNKQLLQEEIFKSLNVEKSDSTENNFRFYRVAYKNEQGNFFIPGENDKSEKNKELNQICIELYSTIEEFNKKPESKEVQKDIEELLFEIAFLFKGIEYQYEHEVRLVQKGVGFDKVVDKGFIIPRVYIELGEVSQSIKKITLGPKVERADEWASALHYELKNKEIEAEIHISRQPFK